MPAEFNQFVWYSCLSLTNLFDIHVRVWSTCLIFIFELIHLFLIFMLEFDQLVWYSCFASCVWYLGRAWYSYVLYAWTSWRVEVVCCHECFVLLQGLYGAVSALPCCSVQGGCAEGIATVAAVPCSSYKRVAFNSSVLILVLSQSQRPTFRGKRCDDSTGLLSFTGQGTGLLLFTAQGTGLLSFIAQG